MLYYAQVNASKEIKVHLTDNHMLDLFDTDEDDLWHPEAHPAEVRRLVPADTLFDWEGKS